MSTPESATGRLLRLAEQGDQPAIQLLFEGHRDKLRRMVAVRMDARLRSRLDPSDVVQETLAEASAKLGEYLRRRPVSFYAWLRQLAWDRLVRLNREHIHTQKRSVTREQQAMPALADESVAELAERLVSSGTSPSGQLLREELRERVREALDRLPPRDRELLVLRYLEQLSSAEVADILGVSQSAVGMRQLRAIQKMHRLLHKDSSDDQP